MATIDYKQLATPEANLIELLSAQNQDGTYTAKLMGSEPFAVLAAKTIYNAYNDIEDNMAADVEGPASSTNNAVVRFDGTTGKLIKNSNAILTDAGALSLASNLTVSGSGKVNADLSITGGLTAHQASKMVLAQASASQSRIYCYGSDTSNVGSFDMLLVRSDGSSAITALSITQSANATLAGNLTVSGRDLTLGSSESVIYFGTSSANYLYYNGSSLFLRVGSVDRITIPSSTGNVLIGTTTDSANGRLQLATHTTSAGGIGFGTDTSLYRSQTGMLALDGLTGSLSQLDLRVGGVQKAFVAWNGGDFYLGAVVGTTVIKSSNTTALTLDSSQNATFAKKVGIGVSPGSYELNLQQSVVNSAIKIISPPALGLNDSSIYIAWASGSKALIAASYESTGSYRPLVLSAGGVDSLTLDATGNATFAGTVTTTGLITVTGTTASIANGATADITLNTPSSLVGYYVRSEGNSNDQSSGFYRSNNNGASSAFVLFGQSEANVAVTTPAAGTIRITNNTGGTIAFAYAFTVLVKR